MRGSVVSFLIAPMGTVLRGEPQDPVLLWEDQQDLQVCVYVVVGGWVG